jgi:hypothetical protein
MTTEPPRSRRRATPPARDILAGQVRDDELPDVARPAAIPPPAAGAPAADERDAATARVTAIAEAAWLPLRLGEAVLIGQADAIARSIGAGGVPAPWIPGARLAEAQLRAAASVLGAVPGMLAPPGAGPPPGGPPTGRGV